MEVLCQQCGRRAIYRVELEDGVLNLCIACNLQREQSETLELHRTTQAMNAALAVFNMQTGIPMPKLPVPLMSIIPVTDMSTTNIHIENSTVGVVNLVTFNM